MSRYIICRDYRGNPRMLSSIHNLLWIVAISYKGLKAWNLFQLIFPLTWPLVAGCAGRPDVVESRGSSPPDSWYQHPAHTPAPGEGGGYYGVIIAGYQTLMVHQPGMTRITFQDSIAMAITISCTQRPPCRGGCTVLNSLASESQY